ncbi:hypothetical protein ZHAS_00006754 [Anopheles sinensis]|uniref:Uncharacterized protein n=1 Tax=Anopheles sinensis TaxID=74873 RepID=A0A084VLW9_ANOSI|nr:hypothetical protein ZHAS_00006754 [Anopheles sinensis]
MSCRNKQQQPLHSRSSTNPTYTTQPRIDLSSNGDGDGRHTPRDRHTSVLIGALETRRNTLPPDLNYQKTHTQKHKPPNPRSRIVFTQSDSGVQFALLLLALPSVFGAALLVKVVKRSFPFCINQPTRANHRALLQLLLLPAADRCRALLERVVAFTGSNLIVQSSVMYFFVVAKANQPETSRGSRKPPKKSTRQAPIIRYRGVSDLVVVVQQAG